MTIDDAKDACRNSESEFTCAVLCSGGCVCTLASIRAGFKMIWGTEICPEHQSTCSQQQEDLICSCNGNTQQRMWEDLTGAPCLGNTFTSTEKYNAVDDPDYLTSGQPCPNYSLSGNRKGEDGETGWMFVQQTKIIIKKQPKIFRLEISDYAIEVNGGSEVNKVIAHLNTKYHVQWKIIKVRSYGDPTN